MKIWTVAAAVPVGLVVAIAQAQTLQEATDQAAIEKAKSEASGYRLTAIQNEIKIQQAQETAEIATQTAKQTLEDAQRKALIDSITAVNALKPDIKSNVNVSGTPIEAKVLTYRATTRAAGQLLAGVSASVCNKASTIVLADDQALTMRPTYEASMLMLSTFASDYENFVKNAQQQFSYLRDVVEGREKALPGALSTLLQGVAAVGAIAQTFKTQISITSADIAVDALAVSGALADAWAAKCPSSVLTTPSALTGSYASSDVAMVVNRLVFQAAQGRDLEFKIALWLVRAKAEAAATPADVAKKPAATQKEATKKDAKQPAAAQSAELKKQVLAQMDELATKLKAANTRVDQAVQQLFTTSDKQPTSTLTQLVTAQRFLTTIQKPNAYLLNVKPVAGGGNIVTTDNFWRGPKIYHSGGVVLAYTLLEGSTGKYVAGGVLDSQEGYVRLNISDKRSLGNSWDQPLVATPAPEPAPAQK